MIDYQFLIQGIDVTEFIIDKPNLALNKGEMGQLLEIPNITLLGDNTKDVFTPGNLSSIFTTGFRGQSIKIYEEGLLIYEGEIRNVNLEGIGNRANIETTAKINRILNYQVPGFSSTQKTLAEISKDLYLLYGIETDDTSYERAKEKQELSLFQVRANVKITSGSILINLQNWLAKTGFCYHYFIGNVAYMDFEDVDDYPLLVQTFDDSDILEVDNYTLIENDIYNGYEVITATGTATKTGLNQAPTLNAYVDQDFIISSPETGYNWGDYQIRLSEREIYEIIVHLKKGSYTSWLRLDSTFGINSTALGINKQFQVLSIDDSSLLGPKIRGQSI